MKRGNVSHPAPDDNRGIGPLSRKHDAKHFTAPKSEFDIPTRVTNCSTNPHTDPYKGTVWNIRDGGNQHEQFQSLPFEAGV